MNQSDAPVMQSYPSPNAIAADSGGPFYSSSNQPPPAMSNPEEFQLAAQLSRAAVPTANAASGGTMIGGQESRGQGNLNRQYEREQIHGTPGQAGQGDIDHMGSSFESPDGSTAPRKRSKVSRACDECRRKKIRCDATGENPDEQCSSCKRVGAQCQFSRVPMKRGPSKGYIKELADRLNTLEGAMQASDIPVGQYVQHHDGLPQRRSSDDASPPKDTENPQRKRTHSSVSGETFPPYQPQRTATTWNSQELPRHLPHPSQSASATSQTFREPNYSPNSIQPAPQWKKVPEILRRQSSSYDSTTQGDPSYIAEQTPEWDEAIINSYYSIIHPTYPILSYPKSRLNSRLANAPPSLKEAFLESLNAAVRSFSAPNIAQRERQGTKRVAQLVLAAHFDNPAVRNISTNLFYLQMMLFMAIEADNYGLSTTHAQVGPPKSAWLGSAVGLAYNMQLHLHKQPDKGSEDDPDSDDKLARRIWWSLVIMDRWHASSLSSPLLIPDSSVIVYPEDQTLLGDVLYHLARLSIVLGHLSAATLIPTDLPSLSIPPTSIVSTLLRGELERCRESFPRKFFPPSNAPIIHLCYWYLRILVELRLFESEPYDLLIPARHIVTQLTLNTSLVNPLTPHATVLAALTLIELLTADSTKEEAENGLNLLLESRIAPSGVDAAVKDLITKRLRSRRATSASNPSHTAASQHILTASQGLQRLADLATAEEGRANTSSDDRMEIETNVGATSPVYQSIRQMAGTSGDRVNMAPTYKLAVIQLYPKPLAIEHNHSKAISFIREAASQSCDLAVLPEYHLTNWIPDDPTFITICKESSKYLSAYCALAAELKICIVPGTIVEVSPTSNHLTNVAYFISSTGEILSKYIKKNLWHPERPHLTSSTHDRHLAFETPIGKVGMLICWDLAFPEAFRELITAGAKTIIIPTFWNLSDCTPEGLAHNPLSEELFLESTVVARCFENTCMVVFANAGGPTGRMTKGSYAGGSCVAVPFKGMLGKLGREEGMSMVEVDMRILEEAEDNYKVRQDLGREGWHYEFALRRDRDGEKGGNSRL